MDGFNFWNMLLLLLLLATRPLAIQALPKGFRIGQAGVELVWTPVDDHPVRMGGARAEFRFASGEVLGYPREIQNQLVLTMSKPEQDLVQTQGQYLEVWSSGRRIDSDGPLNRFARNLSTTATAAGGSVATPTVSVNPAARGTASTQILSYNRKGLQVDGFPFPIEVVGEVIHPKPLVMSVTYPLILFLHGRHSTCYRNRPGEFFDSGEWPCQDGWLPIPSYQGYRYVADILATQGYIVVSISANGINGQDWAARDGGAAARSMLVRHHLMLWATWNDTGGDPWNSRFRGKLDMDKVVLVGHSRGGEGVHRAAIDASSSDPFQIVGLVTYGPTAFGRQVTPDIHSATILPSCDGDVSDLQGQAYVDASRDIAYSEALRSAVIALGCNHNYFNTEWTPGLAKAPSFDDWYDNADPVCGSESGSIRLSPYEQQMVGAVYTAALVRLAVQQDAAMLQFLDGSFVRPKAIGRANVAVNAVGGAASRLLYRPEGDDLVILRNGMTGGECLGYFSFYSSGNNFPVCGGGFDSYITPHWQPRYYAPTHPSPHAMELSWVNRSGAYARFNIPSGLSNLASLDWVDVRVANDPNDDTGGVSLELMILDNSGHNATLVTSLSTVDGWPGQNILDRVHARTLRGRLDSVGNKVNLNNIVAVLLFAHNTSGRVWVIDIAASRSQIQQPVILNLPVISVGTITVPEGNGLQTIHLKITSDQPLKSPGSIWVQKNYYEGYQIDLAVGSTTVQAQIPYSFIGDNLYSTSTFDESVAVGAIRGVVTGIYLGGVTVVEDDPIPTLSAVANVVTTREGQSLRWQLRLSAPTTGTYVSFSVVPPAGNELTSSDVPNSWLQTSFITPPTTSVPLSSLGIYVSVDFAYGVKSAKIVLPIARDRVTEGNEQIKLEGYDLQGRLVTLVGKVLHRATNSE